MPTIAKETQKYHQKLVAQYLVRYPNTPTYKIAEALKFSPAYTTKLVAKVEKERYHRLDHQLLTKDLAKTEDVILGIIEELQDELAYLNESVQKKREGGFPLDPQYSYLKRNLLAEIRQNYITLLDVKFDAGVFDRKLGTIKEKLEHELTEEELDEVSRFFAKEPVKEQPKQDGQPTTNADQQPRPSEGPGDDASGPTTTG